VLGLEIASLAPYPQSGGVPGKALAMTKFGVILLEPIE
jgi:hypothetical protein